MPEGISFRAASAVLTSLFSKGEQIMVRKLGIALLMLFLVPTMAVAGLIYASTPTTTPIRGTISPTGYVSGASPYSYFTITPRSGYMVSSVTLDNVSLYPLTSGVNSGKYAVPYKAATQRLLANFAAATPEQLTALLPATIYVTPGTSYAISGGQSTLALNWGKLATYTWSLDSASATLNPLSGTTNSASAISTLFTGSIPGFYPVTLTLSAPGLPDSSFTTNIVVQTDNVAASRTCLECHKSSSVTSYVSSPHAYNSTKPQYGSTPTCYTCHNPTTPPMAHPGYPLSRVDAVCVTCHRQGTLPSTLSFHDRFYPTPTICVTCHNKHTLLIDPAQLPKPHFNPVTSVSSPDYTAMYVTPRTNCSYCHGTPLRFQNNTTQAALARTDWAKSGKGNVTNPAWKNSPTQNWKTSGTSNASPATSVGKDCVRCHVAKGFTQYVGSHFTNISPVGLSTDKSSEPLTCNTCHNTDSVTNPGFSIRASDPVVAYYNYSSQATRKLIVKFDKFYGTAPYTGLPAVNGGSNLCISCHSGRESGATIKAAATAGLNFNNASFLNSHFMTAAGTLYQSTGYQYFDDSRYQAPLFFLHRLIGTATIPIGLNGPCAGCHMQSADKHSFSPVTKDSNGIITDIVSSACVNCHSYNAGTLQTEKDDFNATLDLLQYMLQSKKGIYYTGTDPVFTTAGGAEFKSWGNANTMGAAFNFNLLKREQGAYAHNSAYSKRLIWDSVDYLDDGVMNGSTHTTIDALDHNLPFWFGAKAYIGQNGRP
jgi:hypothetical protein